MRYCILLFLACCLSCADYAQVEVSNSRLMTSQYGDYRARMNGKNTGYFFSFNPVFSYKTVFVPNYDNNALSEYDNGPAFQAYRSFVCADGKLGFTQGDKSIYCDGVESSMDNTYSIMEGNEQLYYTVKAPGPNSFFLIYVNNPGAFYLKSDKITINNNHTASISNIYEEEIPLGPVVNFPGCFFTDARTHKKYIYTFNVNTKKVNTYSFDTMTGNLKLLSFRTMSGIFPTDYTNDMENGEMLSLSADGRYLLFDYNVDRPYYERSIYVYKTNRDLSITPVEVFNPSTFQLQKTTDSFVGGGGVTHARFSPAGRYIYATDKIEYLDYNKKIFVDSVRLIRIDVSTLNNKGIKPDVKIIQHWQDSSSNRMLIGRKTTLLSIHSFAPDGKIYFQVMKLQHDSQIHVLKSTLYRINNPDGDIVTWDNNVQKMMDSLPYLTRFFRPDCYDVQYWKSYPWHVQGDTICQGLSSTFRFHSSLRYDSLFFEQDSGIALGTLKAPDSVFQVVFPTSGARRIACHVFVGGFESVIYTDALVKAAAKSPFQVLPHLVYSCAGDSVILHPHDDTAAYAARWQDGYAQQDRTVTHTDTLVWNRYYAGQHCPALDTAIVIFRSWKGISLPNVSLCDTTAAVLKPVGTDSSLLAVWDNGDTLPQRVVDSSGRYCVTLYDTLSHCSYIVCCKVTFIPTPPPAWDGLDTSLCRTDVLSLPIMKDYTIVSSGGDTITGPGILKLRDTGRLNIAYNYRGCRFHIARITLHHLPDAECNLCQWYMPNVFVPGSVIPVNTILEPITNCPSHAYRLQVYNRWGEKVYDGSSGWDGTFKGQPCEAGVYSYRLSYRNDGKEQDSKGNVMLLR